MLRVVVTGCPRSGTSMAARILHKSGILMGERFIKGPNNPYGFFEDLDAVAVNTALLGRDAEGRRCESWNKEHLLLIDPQPKYVERVRRFLDHYKWQGFKDPRLVKTWPAWKRVLPERTLLLVTDRPDAAIRRSMERVEGWEYVKTDDPDYCIAWHKDRLATMLAAWPTTAVVQFDDFLTSAGQDRICETLEPFFPAVTLDFASIMGQQTERKPVHAAPRLH